MGSDCGLVLVAEVAGSSNVFGQLGLGSGVLGVYGLHEHVGIEDKAPSLHTLSWGLLYVSYIASASITT